MVEYSRYADAGRLGKPTDCCRNYCRQQEEKGEVSREKVPAKGSEFFLHSFTIEGGIDRIDFYTSLGYEAANHVHDFGTDHLFVPALEDTAGFGAAGHRRSPAGPPALGLKRRSYGKSWLVPDSAAG
jgi:hypothetical protein